MKRKNREGIIFDNTIYLSEENNKRFPVYMRLLQLFTILTGSFNFMAVLIRTFNLKVLDELLIGAVILSGCIFFLFVISYAYGLIKIIFTFTIYGGMFYFLFDNIKNGFFHFENAIIEMASSYYEFPAFRFVADYTSIDRDMTILLIMILIPVTGIFTLSLLRGKLILICYLIMIIPIAGSFAVGITPSELHMISYILVLLFLNISNGQFKLADYSGNNVSKVQKSMVYRINIRTALMVCLLSLFIFFIVKIIIPADKYKNYNQIKETKAKIQSFMLDFSFNDVPDMISDLKWGISGGKSTSSGGLSQGVLGRVDQVVYDNAEHLRVTAPVKSIMEGIYLKGYVGSIYTGDRWKTHDRHIKDNYKKIMESISSKDFEPAIGSSIFLKLNPYADSLFRGRIGIRYLKADKKYVYTPYFVDYEDIEEIKFDYDMGIIPDNEMNIANYNYFYNLVRLLNQKYILSDSGILLNDIKLNASLIDFIKNEEQYRTFVYDTYTRFPERGLERLKEDFSREAVGHKAENLADAISYIKDYLNRNTRYSLSPGSLPKGKDFVEYFLYENKAGYCTHYASAGALMLRAMGYPARYVEGYAVSRSDLSGYSSLYIEEASKTNNPVEITVRDYNAHAWVEVYFDGFGWIPVEFTAASGMGDMINDINDINRYAHHAAEDTLTPTPTPTKDPKVQNPTETPKSDISPTDIPSDKNNHGKNQWQTAKEKKHLLDKSWFLTAVSVLISAAGIVLYILNISKRNKGMANENYSRKALRVYEDIERLFIISHLLPKGSKSLEDSEEYIVKNCRFISSGEFEEFMNIAKKARFGRESIDFMEYTTVMYFYDSLKRQLLNNTTGVRKVYFKIISIKS